MSEFFFSDQTLASFLVGKSAGEDLISSPNVIEISIRREEATFALRSNTRYPPR